MFSQETLEKVWSEVTDYEKVNFGLKYGPDYPQIASILAKSKTFMINGGLVLLAATLEASSRAEKVKKDPQSAASEVFEKAGPTHEALAQMFYVGYKLGREEAERAYLSKMVE